jgi:RNA polymerase sigma factor (sigma-70 family)
VEASAIPASVGLARSRIAIGASLLRIRSDEQLVTLFREGNDEAFRAIHDRYRGRMFAYARQMLGTSGQDPEDAVQEIFMRAYHGLRANRRELALRAWLYRIAHNRCIDDLRRPQLVAIDARDSSTGGSQDPVVRVEQRDALRRLIADVRRLPDQQRSALLMRELSGMSYAEVSGALGVSVPAVKSLLVRARVGLAQASEARNTACSEIRADLVLARDRGVRTSGLARRHLRECHGCRQFRSEVRGVNRQLAALAPTLGPIGIIANLLGWGGGGAATTGGGAVAGSSAAAAGGSAVTAGGTAAGAASAGLLAGGAGHVATLLAAAVVTAGGAVEIQNTLSAVAHHAHHHALVAHRAHGSPSGAGTAADIDSQLAIAPGAASVSGTPSTGQATPATLSQAGAVGTAARRHGMRATPITMLLDPDMYSPQNLPPTTAPAATGSNATSGLPVSSAAPGAAPGTAGSPTDAGGTPTTGAGPSSSGASTGNGSPTSTTPTGTAGSSSATPSSDPMSGSTSSSAAPATGSSSSPSSNSSSASASTSSSSAKKTTSVGSSTSSAGARKVVSFIAHRRSRRSQMLDSLGIR